RDFGLNAYEARLWVALISKGISTAGELSDIANVPRSRSYDVLESLEKKGFIIMKLGKPIKYIAVPPSEVIERVKKYMSQEAEQKLKRLEALKNSDILTELSILHRQGIDVIDPTELSGCVRGRHNLYSHLEMALKNAEHSVTLVTTSEGLLRKVEGLKPIFEKLKKRGVRIRIAAPLGKENKGILKEISSFAEIRHFDTRSRFCIVDGKELIFMLVDDKEVHPTYDVAIWVTTPFFASALENMFDTVWKSMKAPSFK
ncbi:MAG: helix-turn-helix domain-containing protein, partial [Candidatus Woesearchaeota archaeon]